MYLDPRQMQSTIKYCSNIRSSQHWAFNLGTWSKNQENKLSHCKHKRWQSDTIIWETVPGQWWEILRPFSHSPDSAPPKFYLSLLDYYDGEAFMSDVEVGRLLEASSTARYKQSYRRATEKLPISVNHNASFKTLQNSYQRDHIKRFLRVSTHLSLSAFIGKGYQRPRFRWFLL